MRQFEDWRFTKGACDPPEEYIDYVLCHHVYRCTPTELDEQPAHLVNYHLEFWNRENQDAKKRIGKRKRRGTR